jgi:hypothetical protein
MWPFNIITKWFSSEEEEKIIVPAANIKRKAVIVGINKYDGCPLSGCINDAYDIKSRIIRDYGFKDSDIKLLLDEDATTKNIKDSLEWLSSCLKAGDIAFNWESGHGTQIENAEESDGLSEVFCPFDFNWDRDKMITDKDYVRYFSKIPKGVIFCWGSDSCHSGSLSKSVFGPKILGHRSMIMPPNMQEKIRKLKNKGCIPKSVSSGILDVGFISGCRSDQTSADTSVNGRPCGALTHYFLKNLDQKSTLNQVCTKVRKDLKADSYTQIPQTEGTRINKPWLK